MQRTALTFTAAVSFAAALALTLPRVHAASGLPDYTGTWIGTAKTKEFYLDPGEKNGHDKFAISLDITQTGPDATVNVTLTSDEGVQNFTLAGKAGEKTLWAVSADPLNPFIVSLHGDKPGKKLHGIGMYATDEESEEFNLSLKKQ